MVVALPPLCIYDRKGTRHFYRANCQHLKPPVAVRSNVNRKFHADPACVSRTAVGSLRDSNPADMSKQVGSNSLGLVSLILYALSR